MNIYFGEKQIIKISGQTGGWGHAGGDEGLINSMYDKLTGKITDYTSIEESVESHLIGICAERSRLDGGKMIFVHKQEEVLK